MAFSAFLAAIIEKNLSSINNENAMQYQYLFKNRNKIIIILCPLSLNSLFFDDIFAFFSYN